MQQQDFNAQFPDELQGFPGLRLRAGKASALVGAQGAQLLSWQGADGRERLFLSSASDGLRRGDAPDRLAAPIRGGVPVCFPQFSGRGPMIKHGFARGMAWRLDANDGRSATLSCSDNALSREHWPHAFHASVRVALEEDAVTVTLEAHNRDGTAWAFSCALHTYLRLDDVRQARLEGLGGVRYQDATDQNREKRQEENMLSIGAEVDRVYMAPPPALQLHEPGLPVLSISQQGFADTVVWNPGPELARKLSDFPDDGWLHMLCVEAAHAAAPLTLQPGEHWRGSQTLRVLA
ncbi:D-hexose-6-phosphate mutarotase [Noviherbaspirillum aridicola]|uniref:Putative glucose-6-phosphate 1-epimerase n=1 Tax=Noviherbaspirillum aridicola TaxID=2849687 RepID=A0ABQ4Q034_9BURK|nr:D-hexose-6-phosphate mutarotase [Noviherbaspirillum aridicola]GIZ50474.1 D-hexose-6-phosphate mutarotase [Noviherbaspirillum aridicola]